MPPERIRTSAALHALAELAGLGALCAMAQYALVYVDVTDHPQHAAAIRSVLVDMAVTDTTVDGHPCRITSGKIGGVWPIELAESLISPPDQPAVDAEPDPAPVRPPAPRPRHAAGSLYRTGR